MLACSSILAVVALGWGQDPKPPPTPPPATTSATADVITLRDGKVLLGQVVDTADRRAPLTVLVRRAWAEANLPDRAAAWEKAEAPTTRRAETLRHDRLVAWRKSRPGPADPADKITPWLDAEIARLARPADPATPAAKSPLMVVQLGRNSIKGLDRKPKATGRMLRLAWTMNQPDPESATTDDLKQGIEDRGFSAASDSPVAVDSLLPIPLETDQQWAVRRAATEVANLPASRFLLYGGAVLPEPAAGEAPPASAAMGALTSTIKDLLGEEQANPLPAKFRDLAAQGRTGAVVTSLEMAPDMSSTTVATTLWVAPGGNLNWVPAVSRSSTVRPGDLPANAGAGLAEDPQVKAALGAVASLGLGEIPPELKQRSLNMGFATQKALNDARTALNADLANLALSTDAPRDAPTSPPKP